jgi:hypothetical protein
MTARDRTDREQAEHERALRSVDPRRGQESYRPRLRMLDDDRMTNAERGTMQNRFIFPEDSERGSTEQRNRTRRRP